MPAGQHGQLQQVTGVAAGVPFVALPPQRPAGAPSPAVFAWHLADPPRTEAALAAALPLAGLDAWRCYLGLPLSGSRMPAGGPEEILRLGAEDAVLNLQGPTAARAVDEFPAALDALHERFGFRRERVGLLGGSIGSAVAELVLAETDVDVAAAVLVSPVAQLRPLVAANERRFAVSYRWSPASEAVADRLDFVARAREVARRRAAVLLVVGEADDRDGFRRPAQALHDALADRSGDPALVSLVTVPGMAHALADEPGIEPAPQTAHAAAVDAHAVSWLRRHLA